MSRGDDIRSEIAILRNEIQRLKTQSGDLRRIGDELDRTSILLQDELVTLEHLAREIDENEQENKQMLDNLQNN